MRFGICVKCKKTFPLSYMKNIYPGAITPDFMCEDCYNENHVDGEQVNEVDE
jgi:hypothetical protein